MNKKVEAWCYGGKSKAFFVEQGGAIHHYNTKMMERLLLIMTIVLGCYVMSEVFIEPTPHYLVAYGVSFTIVFLMLCLFKLKPTKSFLFTQVNIMLLSCTIFGFVCALGTVLEPNARAIMFIVYLIALPMLFVIPTHYTYGFLTTVTCIFSIISILVKDFEYARMDVAHGITCLVLGLFLSHHILESRVTLYALNKQLDAHNLQLDKQLQEKEIQLLQGRISIMLSQIQPHFLYNALTAICGLCDSDPKEAKKVTTNFSYYLRHNLESLNHNTPIPFEKELNHTKAYLEIEQKRFEQKLTVVYNVVSSRFCIPALTMQPLVENAVKHGVTRKTNGGTVTISTRERADYHEIIIADDGLGFDPSQPMPNPETHIGIANVRSRLWSMCRGTLTIDSKEGCGTTATIRIPKEEIGISKNHREESLRCGVGMENENAGEA